MGLTASEIGQLASRSSMLVGAYRSSENRVREMTAEIQTHENELSWLREQRIVSEAAAEVMKQLVERMTSDHLARIAGLLNITLNAVFGEHRKYSVDLVTKESRGTNGVEIYLVEQMADGKILRSSLQGGVGGSIRCIMGFALALFFLRRYQCAPIIFLDESFGSLSDEFVPPLIGFMRELANRGFRFVLISHDPRITPHADRVYRVERGVVTEESVEVGYESRVEGH